MLRFRPKKKKDKDDGKDGDTPDADAKKADTNRPDGDSCAPTPESARQSEVGDANAPAPATGDAPAEAPADAPGTPDAPQVKGPEADEDPLLRPIAKDERDRLDDGEKVVHSSTGDFYVEDVRARIVDALMTVFDPEIPVDIYQLGLIYSIDIHDDASVDIEMTLTSPACPVAGTLPPEVEDKVATVDGIDQARVEVVWDPPWNPGMMTESARLELGFF